MMMMMMQLFLLTLLITVKQSVTQNIITVDQVSVQQGKSIIIPCLYHADYIHYPKYLCFGTKYFCKDVKQLKNRMVSVSDNQTQHIFTATLKNVTTRDTGAYLCSVEIPGFKPKKSFQLKVTTATPELYVDDQIVTGYEGSHLLISCYHQTRKPNAWCKIGGPCVSTIGNISGASVQLRSTERGFKVTMSELSVDNSGWYWCSAGDQQMPVYISVQSAVPNWESNRQMAESGALDLPARTAGNFPLTLKQGVAFVPPTVTLGAMRAFDRQK
ncbi:CMRF35-like molecule 4 [Bagarius yarrelli]|uniref:CMRF35-like molecule 4 n=1 Tax=Bagarius yarrelli TaxID=175774 RepID=A0A556TJQ2_BAGYA|nr:CMRF35-like molecule 4 [Bagarius yarrelli]